MLFTTLGFADSVREWDNVLKYGERWIEGTFFRRARAMGNDIGYDIRKPSAKELSDASHHGGAHALDVAHDGEPAADQPGEPVVTVDDLIPPAVQPPEPLHGFEEARQV